MYKIEKSFCIGTKEEIHHLDQNRETKMSLSHNNSDKFQEKLRKM